MMEKATAQRPRRGPWAWFRAQLEELYQLLLAPDFTIDERPISIHSGPMTTMELSLLDESSSAAPRDVISLVSAMMRREEKARLEAEEARNRPVEDRQFLLLIKQMLPYLDSFDHVLEAGRDMTPSDEVNNWLKSVEMLYFRILKILERFGLVQLRTLGQSVNLDIHDVVEYRFSAHQAADTVIAERQKGYVLDNKLLRDAKVVVARSPRS